VLFAGGKVGQSGRETIRGELDFDEELRYDAANADRFTTALCVTGRKRRDMMKRGARAKKFTVVLERDEDGLYVASIPTLKGCHTQGKSLDEVMRRIREAAELWIEVHRAKKSAVIFLAAPPPPAA
jgi:predicted RNase H-like HicB family nuclease